MNPVTIAKNVNSIFSMPEVALRINELMNEGDAQNFELEEIMIHDPALTAKTLKFANSAYFGFSGKVDTISRAISLIGHKELHNLVLATSVTKAFDNISSELVDMETFWFHSVTCGVIARLLAANFKRKEQERFFIAGLLHGIGKLILFSQYPEKSVKVLSFRDHSDEEIAIAERSIFGFTYADLGAEFLKQWQIPSNIWKLIGCQINPLSDEEYKDEACILHVAVHIANCIQPCSNQIIEYNEIKLPNNPEAWDHLDLDSELIEPMMEEASMQTFEVLSIIKPEVSMIF